MSLIILIPLILHVWMVHKEPKRMFLDGSIAIICGVCALYFDTKYLYALIVLLCLLLAMKPPYILCFIGIILMIGTWASSYYLIVWVCMEMAFVLYDRRVYVSYEHQMQEYQNKVFDRQAQEVENMFITMRGWRHDYHNHLQNLKAKLALRKIDDSIQYLGELEDELRAIHLLVESGNTNVDAILNAKLSLAEMKEITIHVKVNVPAQIPISDTDMCALLGNLIDNAVEACEKVPSDAYIRLYIGQYKGQLYITCTNATNEKIRKLDHQYITSKRGNHGHGLKRMNIIVERYQGMISRKNEPGVFITEILLPM